MIGFTGFLTVSAPSIHLLSTVVRSTIANTTASCSYLLTEQLCAPFSVRTFRTLRRNKVEAEQTLRAEGSSTVEVSISCSIPLSQRGGAEPPCSRDTNSGFIAGFLELKALGYCLRHHQMDSFLLTILLLGEVDLK